MKTLKWMVLGITLITTGCAGSGRTLREVYHPVNPAIHSEDETVRVAPMRSTGDNTVITQTADQKTIMVSLKD